MCYHFVYLSEGPGNVLLTTIPEYKPGTYLVLETCLIKNEWMDIILKIICNILLYTLFTDLPLVFALLNCARAFTNEAEMKSGIFQIAIVHNARREKRKEGRKDRQTGTVILNSWLEYGMGRWGRRYIGVNGGKYSHFLDFGMPLLTLAIRTRIIINGSL